MSNPKVEFRVKYIDNKGKESIISSTTKEVQDFKDVDKSNFLSSLDKLETALFEGTREVSTATADLIITDGSKKSP
jgi:hypothetical protein